MHLKNERNPVWLQHRYTMLRIIYYRNLNLSVGDQEIPRDQAYRMRNSTFNPNNVGRFCKKKKKEEEEEGAMTEVERKPGMGFIEAKL